MTVTPTKVRSKDGRFAAVCLLVFFVLHAGEALVDCHQSHASATERIAFWDFSRDDDRNFDNVPDNWTRTYDRQHPRYLKLEIVPYDRGAENKLIQYDSVILRGWLAARAWIEQLPEEGWIVSSTPSLLRITRSSLRLLPNLPPSITDKLSNRYLRGEVNGGAITSTSPATPVEIDYSYRLRARMRTEDVIHNNAWVELVFYDASEKPLATISGPRFDGTTPWTQIDVGPASPPVGATTARIVVHFAPMDRADLSGSVGFDDLRLDRSPRIRVETNADRGLYAAPAKPMVRCIVSGIRGEGKSIEFKLLDEAGTQIQTAIVPLHLLSNADNDGNFKQRIQVDGSELAGVALWNLDDVSPGFYQVQASMVQQDLSPFAVTQTFAVLGELPTSPGPFGWSLLSSLSKQIPTRELPEWLEDCRVQWLKKHCWIEPRDFATADDLAWLAGRLDDHNIKMVGVLAEPPPKVLANLNAPEGSPAAILFRDADVWQPLLEPVMTRLSNGISWWQLGSDRDYSFLGRTQLKQAIEEIRVGLQGFGAPIQLAINWPLLEALPPQEEWAWRAVMLSDRTPMTAREIDAYFRQDATNMDLPGKATANAAEETLKTPSLAAKADSGPSQTTKFSTASFGKKGPNPDIDELTAQRPWISLQPLSRRTYPRADRIRDLVTRMIAVRRQQIPAAFVLDPFSPDAALLRSDGSPDEMLLPWRTAAALLANVSPVGQLTLAGESQNELLIDDQSAMLVVWSDKDTEETLYLGDDVHHIDAFGRTIPIEQVVERGFNVQKFRVTTEPSFLLNVDRTAALWRLGVRLDQKRIDSLLGRPQTINLIYENPANQNISGSIRVKAPEPWGVSEAPRLISLASSVQQIEPIAIVLRSDATIGKDKIAFDFELEGDRQRKFTVYRTLEIGPQDIIMDVSTRQLSDGRLVIRQEITNTDGGLKQFDCYVYAPGRRRQRRSTSVSVGQTMVQEFIWDNGNELLGKSLLLRAEQQGGERTLNYEFTAVR